MEPSNGYGLAGLLAAKIVCCGAIVLAATGAISFAGLASWLVGSGRLGHCRNLLVAAPRAGKWQDRRQRPRRSTDIRSAQVVLLKSVAGCHVEKGIIAGRALQTLLWGLGFLSGGKVVF